MLNLLTALSPINRRRESQIDGANKNCATLWCIDLRSPGTFLLLITYGWGRALGMPCSMWILISYAISLYICPNLGFTSNISWIIITVWPAKAYMCFISNNPCSPQAPDLRETFSLLSVIECFNIGILSLRTIDELLVIVYRVSSQYSPSVLAVSRLGLA